MSMNRAMPEIKSIGDNETNFVKGDFKTGREWSEDEAGEMFKAKRYGRIKIIIECKSGKSEMTRLEDVFNLLLVSERESENSEVLKKKLENLIPQLSKLIGIWTEEIRK